MRKPYMIIMITDHTRQTYLEQNMETYWDTLRQSGVGNCHFNGIYNVFEFEHGWTVLICFIITDTIEKCQPMQHRFNSLKGGALESCVGFNNPLLVPSGNLT